MDLGALKCVSTRNRFEDKLWKDQSLTAAIFDMFIVSDLLGGSKLKFAIFTKLCTLTPEKSRKSEFPKSPTSYHLKMCFQTKF